MKDVECPVCHVKNVANADDKIAYCETVITFFNGATFDDDNLQWVYGDGDACDTGYMDVPPGEKVQAWFCCNNSTAHPDGIAHWWRTDRQNIVYDANRYIDLGEKIRAAATINDLRALLEDTAHP